MIVFDLTCGGLTGGSGGHRFEGWFASSEDFAAQQARGLVTCPHCGSAEVSKAPMAPNLARKGNQGAGQGTGTLVGESVAAPQAMTPRPAQPPSLPPEAMAMLHKIAAAQAEALKSSRWVGKSFAEDARAIHYGEREAEPIHGEASLHEAEALAKEGIMVAPILFPLAPPDQIN